MRANVWKVWEEKSWGHTMWKIYERIHGIENEYEEDKSEEKIYEETDLSEYTYGIAEVENAIPLEMRKKRHSCKDGYYPITRRQNWSKIPPQFKTVVQLST